MNRAISILFVAIILCVAMVGVINKYSQADFKNSTLFLYDKSLMKWARENTAEDALFLIPTYFHAWQESHRATFYDPNIINAASYNKVYMNETMARFQVLMGIDLKNADIKAPRKQEVQRDWSAGHYQREKYDELTETKVLEMGRKYNIEYFVASSTKKYSFPIVYRNKMYTVYVLNP